MFAICPETWHAGIKYCGLYKQSLQCSNYNIIMFKWFIVLCQLLNNPRPFNIWTWEQDFLIICPVCSSHDCMHSSQVMKLHSLLAAHIMHIALLHFNSSCFFRIQGAFQEKNHSRASSESRTKIFLMAPQQSLKWSCEGVIFKLSCETSDSDVRITLSVSSFSQHEIIHNPS